MTQEVEETKDGMHIVWDQPIVMDDGVVLRADVFRPVGDGSYPVIMTYGPYGKGLHFEDGYKTAWDRMCAEDPDAVSNTSNKYANWEVADPEKWVPDGYVVVRVDSRGAGRSPGYLCHNNDREQQDYYQCIEWAGTQRWSNGKVGLNGISYYGANQWRAAGTQPPHLAAICVWEGWHDNYRDGNRHGGILCTFRKHWQDMQVKTVQHGVGDRGRRSRVTGELVCGPETLSDDELIANRENMHEEMLAREMLTDYYLERSAKPDRVKVPVLSAGNWGGAGLHARGNFEGFLAAASEQKWLEVHGGSHWAPFYTDRGVSLQKQFFDHFLKGHDNGWGERPKVQLLVRHPGERFVERFENEWPLARTSWQKVHLSDLSELKPAKSVAEKQLSFDALGDGLTFLTEPTKTDTEITGPIDARLAISSSTEDADLFLVVRVFTPDMKEVTFQGALDPHTPIAQGWLRASHRKLDPDKSLPYRPWHTHDEKQPLEPGQIYQLDIEIWPTCIVIPKGYRLALSVRGKDYVYPGGSGGRLSNMKNEFTGCGPFLHDDENDRPPEVFGGTTTIHFGEGHENYVLLPYIPAAS
jgi:predicted acyl esterase